MTVIIQNLREQVVISVFWWQPVLSSSTTKHLYITNINNDDDENNNSKKILLIVSRDNMLTKRNWNVKLLLFVSCWFLNVFYMCIWHLLPLWCNKRVKHDVMQEDCGGLGKLFFTFIFTIKLYCVQIEFRLLDECSGCSRIWWNSSQLRNSGWMSISLC